MMAATSMLGMIPCIVLGALISTFTKKIDKMKLYYGCLVLSLVMLVVRFFVGYHNVAAYLIATFVSSIPAGITSTITFMFTPDCAEYGHYKFPPLALLLPPKSSSPSCRRLWSQPSVLSSSVQLVLSKEKVRFRLPILQIKCGIWV